MAKNAAEDFIPALIVVDMQEDFCPPNGSLAVAGGRDIAPPINQLLDLPFKLKVATLDWHPANSLTFASQHIDKHAFTDFADLKNPDDPAQSRASKLWPDHCVQNTAGAELIRELHKDKIDVFIRKAISPETEMYSGFKDIFGRKGPLVVSRDLAAILREKEVTHLYVVGLAGNVCVKHTAIDAAEEGFTTYVVLDCTRCSSVEGEEEAILEYSKTGVQTINMASDEIRRITSIFTKH